jgi:hypothetical protein
MECGGIRSLATSSSGCEAWDGKSVLEKTAAIGE